MPNVFRARPLVQVAWDDPTEYTKPALYQYFRALDIYTQCDMDYDFSGSWEKKKFYVTPFLLKNLNFLYGMPFPSVWYCEAMRCLLMAGNVTDADNTLTSDYSLPLLGSGKWRKNDTGGTTGSNSKYIWRVYENLGPVDITGGNYFYEGYGQKRKIGEGRCIVYGNSNPDPPITVDPIVDHVRSDFAPGREWHQDDCFAIRFFKYSPAKTWDTETYPPRFVVGLPGGNYWIDVVEGQKYNLWKKQSYWDNTTDPPTLIGTQNVVVAEAILPVSQWESSCHGNEHQFCVWFVNHSNKTSVRGDIKAPTIGKSILITADPYLPNPANRSQMLVYSSTDLDILIDETKPFWVYGVGGAYYFSWHPMQFSQSAYVISPWYVLAEVPDPSKKPHVKAIYVSNPEGENNPITEAFPPGTGALTGGWDVAKPTRVQTNDPTGKTAPDTIDCERAPDPNGAYGYRWAFKLCASEEQKDITTPYRQYRTPTLFGIEIKAETNTFAPWNPVALPAIDTDEIVSVGGLDQIRAGSATQLDITFRNRDGRWNSYDGAHQFVCDINWLLSDGTTLVGPEASLEDPFWTMFRRFTGFLWSPQYSRGPDGEGVVTLTAVGRDQILADEICLGTPIYDGCCSLWVIWDLARRAGFTNDQILLYQDPRNPASYARVLDMYAGADDDAKETEFETYCGHGMCHLAGYQHRILDYGAWQGEPVFLFDDGLPIIQAIDKVAQSGGDWYFVNNYGNLVYLSPKCTPESKTIAEAPYGQVQKTFKEVPDFDQSGTILGYNEIRRNLNVSIPMDHRRNSFYVQGLDIADFYAGAVAGYFAPPRPISALYKEDLNIPTMHRIPWHRWAIKADPNLVNSDQVNGYFNWLVRAGTRKRMPVSFTGWLHPDIFWLDGVYVEESFREPGSATIGQTPIGEQSLNRVPVLIESIRWDINMDSLEATMTIDGEVVWPGDELLWTTFI